MPSVTLVIHNKVGLHARPAALLVQTAQRFQSDVKISCDAREGNAKSLLEVLGLGANRGAEITIEARGHDAGQALAALEKLVETDFGEKQ